MPPRRKIAARTTLPARPMLKVALVAVVPIVLVAIIFFRLVIEEVPESD